MLYSHNNQYPDVIPFRIQMANGRTRTDPTTFTDEEISDAGYVKVDNPPEYFYPNKLIWNGDDWEVVPMPDSEIYSSWNQIRNIRNKLLQESDIVIMLFYENNTPVPQEWKTYRQELRNITLQENPWSVVWPQKPNS